MTLKDAREAAKMSVPVNHIRSGIGYAKITKIGYTYGVNGERPFIELLDKNQNSTIQVHPEECALAFQMKGDET